MGNWWHRGACIQSPGPSLLPQQQPPHLPVIPSHHFFLPIHCLGSCLSFPTDLSLLLRSHPAIRAHCFSLDRRIRTLKCPCWAKLQSCNLGLPGNGWGRRGNCGLDISSKKKQLKTSVFIQAYIPALHLKSKHRSTKNLKRENETTNAPTSTTQSQKMLTAGHEEQHNKVILLLKVRQ